MKKRWYDFLWIASLLYLVLGFFNILFAWLGLLCFFIPLVIAFAGGDKGYCNRFCGRGQLFSLLGGRFGLSRRADIPRWMKSKAFRYGFLGFFLLMFFQSSHPPALDAVLLFCVWSLGKRGRGQHSPRWWRISPTE